VRQEGDSGEVATEAEETVAATVAVGSEDLAGRAEVVMGAVCRHTPDPEQDRPGTER